MLIIQDKYIFYSTADSKSKEFQNHNEQNSYLSFDFKLNVVKTSSYVKKQIKKTIPNKQITTIKKELYAIAKNVKASHNSCIKVIDYVDFVNNEIPFEATAEITAIGYRYKKDGTIIKNAKVDEDAVNLFLKFQAKVQGIFCGSYVLRTYRKLDDMILESSVAILNPINSDGHPSGLILST
ncbi:6981_t:CDS:2 [Diversispora eburnea]|uniref:6981_t:CDS:1 n=1 Tax=Diversispora eburnea TaxID=1213867 RepID=A0A9N9B907_9GLOM|nr:6981_t:CDS:2 [Diversispora eburnea]